MPNVVSSFLPAIETHGLPGLNAGENILYPAYNGYSLGNIPASICHWLNIPPFGIRPLADELLNLFPGPFQNVVLMVVDGLGLHQLQEVIQPEREKQPATATWQRLMQEATLAPLTSIVPSTTATALTTLWTGSLAAGHGVVGYDAWLKEYGMVANMILQTASVFSPSDVGGLRRAGFQPETFLPVPTLGPHLLKNNIQPYTLQHQSIARSGLSLMHMSGVNILPFRTLSDMWVSLSNLLDARKQDPTYAYLYWGDLDELSHRFGPGDERVALEFASFSLLLERFLARLKSRGNGSTLFLLTADHGHMHTPRNPLYEIKNHPEFASYLTLLPTGESRFSYLHIRPGCEDALRRYVETVWPTQFKLLNSAEALKAGLFGSDIYAKTPERMGDLILVAQEDAFLWVPERDNPLLGRHGGMSPTEMLIPLVGWVL